MVQRDIDLPSEGNVYKTSGFPVTDVRIPEYPAYGRVSEPVLSVMMEQRGRRWMVNPSLEISFGSESANQAVVTPGRSLVGEVEILVGDVL